MDTLRACSEPLKSVISNGAKVQTTQYQSKIFFNFPTYLRSSSIQVFSRN